MMVTYLVPISELNEHRQPQRIIGDKRYWEAVMQASGPLTIGDAIEFIYQGEYQKFSKAYKIAEMVSINHYANKHTAFQGETLTITLRDVQMGEPI